MSLLLIKIKDEDNVAVALKDINKGMIIDEYLVALDNIPQAHKIALKNINEGKEVIRYGVTIGYAKKNIKKGELVKEEMLSLPLPPNLNELEFGKNIISYESLPEPVLKTWKGYKSPYGGYAGTRNILGIHTTVQCVSGVLDVAIDRIRRELLPKFENVDEVVAINHAYGCGVAINARDAHIPIRALKNIVKHSNFGGVIMAVGLGCEKMTFDMLLDEEENIPENIIILQDCKGFSDMIDKIIEMAKKKLAILNKRKREVLPLSDLLIGMQCGGSDAFSGISANPSAGYAADMLVKAGATVMFSEVTEVRDGIDLLAQRCINKKVMDKLIEEMKWYDSYLDEGEVDRSANPTPGNKKGGLANIVEKAMGSITKSGSAPIVEVLSPAQRPTKKGLIYAATPASDIVCGPCQVASGIGLQVFMTGRGTPYNLAISPVIKVCSRNEMKEQWTDLIDINAGPVAKGEASIKDIGEEIFKEIIAVASGEKKTLAEKYKIYNFMAIFNPAPIT